MSSRGRKETIDVIPHNKTEPKDEFYFVLGVPISKAKKHVSDLTDLPVLPIKKAGMFERASQKLSGVFNGHGENIPHRLSEYPRTGYSHCGPFVNLVMQRNVLVQALMTLPVLGVDIEEVIGHLNRLLDSLYAILVTVTHMTKFRPHAGEDLRGIQKQVQQLHRTLTQSQDPTVKAILTDAANAKTHELIDAFEMHTHGERVQARMLQVEALLSSAIAQASKFGISQNDRLLQDFREALQHLFTQIELNSCAYENLNNLLPEGSDSEEPQTGEKLQFYLQHKSLWETPL
jgi:hypothetical protein